MLVFGAGSAIFWGMENTSQIAKTYTVTETEAAMIRAALPLLGKVRWEQYERAEDAFKSGRISKSAMEQAFFRWEHVIDLCVKLGG